jgi:riboflavin kinase/FMN adenylyltransferase
MNVIYDLNKVEKTLENPVLTIGNFDGVHKGHLALFDRVKERAAAIAGRSAVMTFEPHPVKFLSPGSGPPLITPTEQKLQLIAEAGIDFIFCMAFTRQFASVSARDFVKNILVDRIGIREVIVGYDYAFGYGRGGNTQLLTEMGKDLGFRVHLVEPVRVDHTLVSSTSIRKLVQDGDLTEANKLLGRDYGVTGKVVKGRNRGGRLLGFPTANLDLIDELIPKRGVYAVRVQVGGNRYSGVTNIGYNPTFGDNALSVETHVLDFTGDLVGKTIRVFFVRRLRDEKAFESVDALSEQIARDVQQARGILGNIAAGEPVE